MADTTLKVRVGLDISDLVTGLRDAAARLEAAQVAVNAHGDEPTRDDVLEALEDMVVQHSYRVQGDTYESMALSANADAMRLLVRAGRATFVNEPKGRMVTITLIPPVVAGG